MYTNLNKTDYTRFMVGDFNKWMSSTVPTIENQENYPPYNLVELDEDNYLIQIAVAGFKDEDIVITLDKKKLHINGNIKTASEKEPYKFVHKGIAKRNFTRSFLLEEHIEVSSANLVDGMLEIRLVRKIPEELKPVTIPIGRSVESPQPQLLKG